MDILKKWSRLVFGLTLSASLLTGCAAGMEAQPTPSLTILPTAAPTAAATPTPKPTPTAQPTPGVEDILQDPTYTDGGSQDETSAGESLLAVDGTYSSMEDVALYLHTYGELPDNFMTKNEARELGWSGGGLDDYAPGMCIGGDTFGNREGILPKGTTYHECDIDTLGADRRGAQRLVWDEEGNIYYTDDHYESFELIYEAE